MCGAPQFPCIVNIIRVALLQLNLLASCPHASFPKLRSIDRHNFIKVVLLQLDLLASCPGASFSRLRSFGGSHEMHYMGISIYVYIVHFIGPYEMCYISYSIPFCSALHDLHEMHYMWVPTYIYIVHFIESIKCATCRYQHMYIVHFMGIHSWLALIGNCYSFLSFLPSSYELTISPSTYEYNITQSPIWLILTCLISDPL